ncbi:hypothetical protein [Cryobacterium psychrophilum]|uniref:Polysaccharide biosynthesis protein n=1 Tax=Cryobacterium psychrophilum TaxID=41988 RepID=A0A4Y8KRK5_9MICO|nr:hypothetical protein [Cryobacterium psychrophilum]TDW29786.1 O-antigen/teichoic acid export membrane protein [Cryobacterium psychrophilum]TFD81883.1 hypothetical protein E3T53_02535 [Cryobacterium psychrophilum]
MLFVLFARSVDSGLFGEVNALIGIAAFLGVMADLGLSTFIVKAFAVDRDISRVAAALRINQVSTSIFALLLSALYLVACSAVGWTPWAVLVIAWVAFEKNVEAQLGVFIAQQAVVTPAVSIAIRRILPVLCFISLSSFDLASELTFGISLLVGSFGGALHAHFSIRRQSQFWETETIAWRLILREALPYSLTNIASQARNLDIPIVALLSGTSSAGIMAAASKVSIPIFLVASAIGSAVMPAVARGGLQFSRRLLAYLSVGTIVATVMAICALPWSNAIMGVLFGSGYSDAGNLLVLVVVGTIFAAVASPLSSLAQAYRGAHATAVIGLIFGVALLAGVAMGSLVAGVEGAAWAALAVQFLRVISMVVLVKRLLF